MGKVASREIGLGILAALAAIGSGQVAEARKLVSKPMNRAAIERALELTETAADPDAKRILIDNWVKAGVNDEDFIGLVDYCESSEHEPGKVSARHSFAAMLIANLLREATDETSKVKGAALEAIARLTGSSTFLQRSERETIEFEPDQEKLVARARNAIVDLADKTPSLLFPYLQDKDSAVFFPIARALRVKHRKEIDAACRSRLHLTDAFDRRVALYLLLQDDRSPEHQKDAPNWDELLKLGKALDDPSPLTREHCFLPPWHDFYKFSAWIKVHPFAALPSMAKISIINWDTVSDELLNQALTDTDIDVVCRALTLVEPDRRLELLPTYLPKFTSSTYGLDALIFYAIDGNSKRAPVNAEIVWNMCGNLPKGLKARIAFDLAQFVASRETVDRLVRVCDDLDAPVAIDELSADREAWAPSAKALVESKNLFARRLGAQIVVFMPASEAWPGIGAIMSDPDDEIASAVWLAYDTIPLPEREKAFKAGIDRHGWINFEKIVDLRNSKEAWAHRTLIELTRSSNPQIAELALLTLMMPKESELSKIWESRPTQIGAKRETQTTEAVAGGDASRASRRRAAQP